MFPNHKNLLPSYFDVPDGLEKYTTDKFVSKPKFAREGTGIKFSTKDETLEEFI